MIVTAQGVDLLTPTDRDQRSCISEGPQRILRENPQKILFEKQNPRKYCANMINLRHSKHHDELLKNYVCNVSRDKSGPKNIKYLNMLHLTIQTPKNIVSVANTPPPKKVPIFKIQTPPKLLRRYLSINMLSPPPWSNSVYSYLNVKYQL